MSLVMSIYTWMRGTFAGKDEFGNRYYFCKNDLDLDGRNKRWVLYNGYPEPSKVPAIWFSWLHHLTDVTPSQNTRKKNWEKGHLPNLTGTRGAYFPKSHTQEYDRTRDDTIGDYQTWRP